MSDKSEIEAIRARDMTHIVERLRARLIFVPKPGTEWRDTLANEWIDFTIGGEHKAGDDAGLQYQTSMHFAGLQSKPKVRPHIYAVEPLCAEAADRIDALEARVARLEGALRAMVATGKYWQGPKNKKILDQAFAALDNRPCTCHPDDNPPRPCPQKYALSECILAALAEVKP